MKLFKLLQRPKPADPRSIDPIVLESRFRYSRAVQYYIDGDFDGFHTTANQVESLLEYEDFAKPEAKAVRFSAYVPAVSVPERFFLWAVKGNYRVCAWQIP